MVFHQFVDCPRRFLRSGTVVWVGVFAAVDARHEGLPVRFDDLGGAVVEGLLDEDEHLRTKGPGSAFPHFEFGVSAFVRPTEDFVVVFPAVDQEAFQVSHR